MSKFLDLRNKSINQVKVVEHIIFKPRSFKVEMIKMFSIIAIVTVIGFGISSANDFVENQILNQAPTPAKNFSATGIVSDIARTTLSLTDAKGSNDETQTIYTFDIQNVEKIETAEYLPLALTDITVGDRLVVQGTDQDGTISIFRIISLTATSSKTIIPEVATTTATTTDETASSTASIATTTIDTSTSTEISTTTDATTTPSIIEKITDTPGQVIDTVTDTIQNVIDTITGTTTEENKPAPEPEVVTPPTTEATPAPEASAPPETPVGVSDPVPSETPAP